MRPSAAEDSAHPSAIDILHTNQADIRCLRLRLPPYLYFPNDEVSKRLHFATASVDVVCNAHLLSQIRRSVTPRTSSCSFLAKCSNPYPEGLFPILSMLALQLEMHPLALRRSHSFSV